MSVIVVGAGVGGLSVAALLADKGRKVTVIEKNSTAGGRARVLREEGFTFDMGPSWYLMPDIYEKYFSELGLKSSDLYDLKRIDPSYRVFFEDGSSTDVSAGLEDNLELFDSFEQGGGEKLKQYLGKAAEHYRIAVRELLYRDYDSLRNLLDGRLLLDGVKLPLFGNIDAFLDGIFTSDKAKRLLEYSIGFVGGSPRNTPTIYYIMNHVDFNLGVWYPMGGIGKIVESLQRICTERGVEFTFNEAVTEILVENGAAVGVSTAEKSYHADEVIVTADYPHSELELLKPKHRSHDRGYWESRLFSPPVLVIYIGLDKKLPALLHHNLYLAGDWSLSFNTLYDPENPVWPGNVSYYVNVTSRTDDSVAPPECETVFILVPLPQGVDDTPESREMWYRRVVGHLEGVAGEAIIGHERVKRLFGPRDFVEDYNAYGGTSLGLVHTLRQSAVFRPSHRSRRVRNLFYSGQYTHPGIGVPLVLISSEILAGRLVVG